MTLKRAAVRVRMIQVSRENGRQYGAELTLVVHRWKGEVGRPKRDKGEAMRRASSKATQLPLQTSIEAQAAWVVVAEVLT